MNYHFIPTQQQQHNNSFFQELCIYTKRTIYTLRMNKEDANKFDANLCKKILWLRIAKTQLTALICTHIVGKVSPAQPSNCFFLKLILHLFRVAWKVRCKDDPDLERYTRDCNIEVNKTFPPKQFKPGVMEPSTREEYIRKANVRPVSERPSQHFKQQVYKKRKPTI